MSKIIQVFFIIITSIFLIGVSLMHSRLLLLDSLYISGNYEFFKVFIINTFFVYIFLISYIFLFRNISISKKMFYILASILVLLIVSTFNSQIPYNSLFGGTTKGHGFFFMVSLILIYLYFYFGIEKFGKSIFEKIFLILGIILVIFGYKELFFPSFDYGVIGNRMLSTFGHPNYVAGFLVLLFPYVFFQEKKYCGEKNTLKKYIYITLLIILLSGIILTQSAIAVAIITGFLIFNLPKIKSTYKFIILILIGIIGFVVLWIIAPEKFSSFISRYYIWETSLKIIFSDYKIFLWGIGSENLTYFFDSFKSNELYLYERIGYSASRAHNIFLDFWLNYGIISIMILFSLIIKIIKNFNKNFWYNYSLVFVFIFYFFHFPNSVSYIFIVFLLTLWTIQNRQNKISVLDNKIQNIFISILIILGLLGSYFSYNYYQAQRYAYDQKYQKAIDFFPYDGEYYFRNLQLEKGLNMQNNFISEKYLLFKIYFGENIISQCNNLVEVYPTVENYFYCGEKIEKKYGFEKAKPFYQKGIDIFPDIFTQNNKYLNNFPGKYIINKQNITSPKFSNIQEIINKLE